MKAILLSFFTLLSFSAYCQVTQSFTTSGTFTVPAGVTSIFVEAWGSGGSGGGAIGNASPQFRAMGGGGGGGAYSSGTITVTPNQMISYTVASETERSTTTPINGSSSTFSTISASGGTGGQPAAATTSANVGGAGGTGGVGTTNGGNGGSGGGYNGDASNTQPGGGGAGGTTSNGGDGLVWQTEPSVANGGAGGILDGGNGANGIASSGTSGRNGTAPGGGGSGAYGNTGGSQAEGGRGARGQIRITYTANLPVSLYSFSVRKVQKSTIIDWTTTYENSSSHFLIQRSFDGVSFATIGQIKSVGNSNITNNYSFLDEQPKKGNNYYRLVQVDLDGTKNTYKTEMVYMPYEKGFELLNTVLDQDNSELQIKSDVEKYNLSIYSITGHKVMELQNVSYDQTMDTKVLARGTYIIHLEGNGAINSLKFIKN